MLVTFTVVSCFFLRAAVSITKYIHIYIHISIYMCVWCLCVGVGVCVYVCACVCVLCVYVFCVCMFEKRNVRRNPGGASILTCKSFDTLGEGGERQNRTISQTGSLQRFPPDNWSVTASSGKVNDWVESGSCFSHPILKRKRVRSKGFFGEPLGSSDNPRGQILVSRTGDDTLRVLCGVFVVCLRCVWCVWCVCVWCWGVTLTPPPPSPSQRDKVAQIVQ